MVGDKVITVLESGVAAAVGAGVLVLGNSNTIFEAVIWVGSGIAFLLCMNSTTP
jgi:hypothetical protein